MLLTVRECVHAFVCLLDLFLLDVWTGLTDRASAAAGLASALVMSPVDVIKTRLMVNPDGAFKGIADCIATTMREEGVRGFYRGFTVNVLRIMPQTILTFIAVRACRRTGWGAVSVGCCMLGTGGIVPGSLTYAVGVLCSCAVREDREGHPLRARRRHRRRQQVPVGPSRARTGV